MSFFEDLNPLFTSQPKLFFAHAFLQGQQRRFLRVRLERLFEQRFRGGRIFLGEVFLDLLCGGTNENGAVQALTALGVHALEVFTLEVDLWSSLEECDSPGDLAGLE